MTQRYSGEFSLGTKKRKNNLTVGPTPLVLGELATGTVGLAYHFETTTQGIVRAVLEAAGEDVSNRDDSRIVAIERVLISIPPDVLIEGMNSEKLKLDSHSASRLLAAISIALKPKTSPALKTGEIE